MGIPYKRILVTLDGSEVSKQAFPHAESLAHQTKAQLFLLWVVPYLSGELGAEDGLPLDYAKLAQQQQQQSAAAMQELQALVAQSKVPHSTASVEDGDAAAKIVDYARTYAIDLIVMCTHGRSGLGRWYYGSVTNKVMQNAPCPLLLIRASDGTER